MWDGSGCEKERIADKRDERIRKRESSSTSESRNRKRRGRALCFTALFSTLSKRTSTVPGGARKAAHGARGGKGHGDRRRKEGEFEKKRGRARREKVRESCFPFFSFLFFSFFPSAFRLSFSLAHSQKKKKRNREAASSRPSFKAFFLFFRSLNPRHVAAAAEAGARAACSARETERERSGDREREREESRTPTAAATTEEFEMSAWRQDNGAGGLEPNQPWYGREGRDLLSWLSRAAEI